jgi:large subunit ribosomal protein L18
MDTSQLKRNGRRNRRAMRIRKHVRGSGVKPRLCVYKTNAHISAQLIDDETGLTIVSAGTQHNEFKKTEFGKKSKEAARKIGAALAEKAKEKSITVAVFDRGFYKFHGIIAELAAGAREAGLQV